MSTVVAPLRGWVPLLNLDQRPSVPLCFVFQLADKLAPPNVTNGLGQTVILDLQALVSYKKTNWR